MATYIRTHRTLDANLQMKDAGAVTADAAWTVGGSAQILDMGDTRFEGVIVIDVSAIDITSTDEIYVLSIQGSSSATFASTIQELACLRLGDASTIGAARDVDSTAGRYELYFSNYQDGVVYRYIRGYTDVSGTTPSINHVSYLCKI